MAEEIAVQNGRISNFEGLVTLTLTLDLVILHTFVHHSWTSTYIPNFIEIEATVFGRTDVHTDGRTVPSSKSPDTKKSGTIKFRYCALSVVSCQLAL